MKTALESLDALEALARRIANMTTRTTEQDGVFAEARSIVSELTPPVDPVIIQARQILADTLIGDDKEEDAQRYLAGANDKWFATRAVMTALRQAREQGREEGRGGV